MVHTLTYKVCSQSIHLIEAFRIENFEVSQNLLQIFLSFCFTFSTCSTSFSEATAAHWITRDTGFFGMYWAVKNTNQHQFLYWVNFVNLLLSSWSGQTSSMTLPAVSGHKSSKRINIRKPKCYYATINMILLWSHTCVWYMWYAFSWKAQGRHTLLVMELHRSIDLPGKSINYLQISKHIW